jgi:hypothetical protein
MERCAFCKVEETALYDSGVPICLKCVAAREAKAKKDRPPSVHDILVGELAQAQLDADSATAEFNAMTSDIPSFIPPPDGTRRIHNASNKLTDARKAIMKAHHRLNEFLESGMSFTDAVR